MKQIYNYTLLILVSIFAIGCSSSDNDEIIKQDKFINILVDIHVADALIADKGLYDGNLKDSTKSYYNYIFKKHNISRASFDKSMEYYSKDAEHYYQIYDIVIDEISKQIPVKLHKESIYNIIIQAREASKKTMKR